MKLFSLILIFLFGMYQMNMGGGKWTPLFDGKSTAGWHKYGGGPVGEAWKVSDGLLYLDTLAQDDWKIKGGGDIVTDKEYENFHLQLEWKISRGGNSGIMFYVHEDARQYPNSYETGPEMQILDNEGHPDARIHKHRAGDLYDLIPCSVETVKPYGHWNKVDIIANRGDLTFKLNGKVVVHTKMWDQQWNDMIAASKFHQWPGFGTFRKGRICLQDHGNMVWFRNIRIKEL